MTELSASMIFRSATTNPYDGGVRSISTRRRSEINVVFVCTAGRCRSPIAATLLEKRLSLVNSAVSVDSLGLKVSGEPTPDIGLSLLADRGIEMSPHRSSPVTPQALADADLVLGMTRAHVREVVAMSPDSWPKSFTLIDFVRRAQTAGPRRRHQHFSDWLDSVGADREPADLLFSNADDEVLDPFNQRVKVWRQVIDDLDGLVSALPGLLGLSRDSRSQRASSRAQGA